MTAGMAVDIRASKGFRKRPFNASMLLVNPGVAFARLAFPFRTKARNRTSKQLFILRVYHLFLCIAIERKLLILSRQYGD